MAYDMVVIVREVWDTRDLVGQVVDAEGALQVGGLSTRMETEDLNALETALRLKDAAGGTVTALAIGGPREVDVLKECLYRGADGAVRIDADREALDARAAAALLAAAITRQSKVDLVLGGVTVPEGENALALSLAAGMLDMELTTYVDEIVSIGDGAVVARRAIEMGTEDVALPLPAVVAMGVALVEDDPRTPRSAKAMLKLKHKKTEIPVLTPEDVGVDVTQRAVDLAGRAAIPERVIESREVDPEDEAALRAMLDDVLKGA